jgi:hypothetical protein
VKHAYVDEPLYVEVAHELGQQPQEEEAEVVVAPPGAPVQRPPLSVAPWQSWRVAQRAIQKQ